MHSTRNHLLVLLFTAIILRIAYMIAVPTPITAPDTYGYNLVGHRILTGSMPLFNDERTPVYPIMLNLVMKVAGRTDVRLDTPAYFQGASILTAIQSFAGIISVLVFYLLLERLRFGRRLRLLVSLIFTFNIMLFGWERMLLTESFSILMLLLITYSTVRLIDTPNHKQFFLLISFSIIAFLLRPIFIALPILLLPMLAYIHRKTVWRYTIIMGMIIYTIIPITYVASNTENIGYRGINHITDINILGRILKDDLPLDAGREYQWLYDGVNEYRRTQSDFDPYSFLQWYSPDLLIRADNREELDDIRQFSMSIARSQASAYITGALADIPEALTDVNEKIAPGRQMMLRPLWSALYQAYSYLHYAYLLSLLVSIFILIRFRGHKKTASDAVVAMVALYMILVTVLAGYSGYARILAPTHSLLLILLFLPFINTKNR